VFALALLFALLFEFALLLLFSLLVAVAVPVWYDGASRPLAETNGTIMSANAIMPTANVPAKAAFLIASSPPS
jgi:hypothetical protein